MDIHGLGKTVDIRYDQEGKKLTSLIQVLNTLGIIKHEVNEGIFDVRKYESKSSRESFLFKNFIEKKYLPHQENKLERNEISYNGLRDKKSLIKNHLLPYFKNIDISKISPAIISDFRDSYTKHLRARDKATSELKTILIYAHKKELINGVPHFDKIARSKQKKAIPTMDVVQLVIDHLPDHYRNIFTILSIYPIRPSEIRCLRWKDINLRKREMTISRHMSGPKEMDGRKSISGNHEKASITYPITDEVYLILKSLPRAIDKELLVFPSLLGHNKIMSHSALPDNWNKACDLAGVERFHSYEVKHARITEITDESNGNMIEVMDVTGHTNLNTVMRYSKSKSDIKKFFH